MRTTLRTTLHTHITLSHTPPQSLFLACTTLIASRVIHNRVFATMLHATMATFDTTPTGRILSRFAGDIDQLDTCEYWRDRAGLGANGDENICIYARVWSSDHHHKLS